MGMMAAFPGACACCEAGHGCSGHTAFRIFTFVTALVVCAFTLLVATTWYTVHQAGAEVMPPQLVAFLAVIFPLGSFGCMTLARFISQTKEGAAGQPMPLQAASNCQQCGGIAVVMVLLCGLAPIIVSNSSVDVLGGGTTGGDLSGDLQSSRRHLSFS
jgi:hypothetical protein